MSVKLSQAQAILLRTLVNSGPQFMPKGHVTSNWLVSRGFATWEKTKLKATADGTKFVQGE